MNKFPTKKLFVIAVVYIRTFKLWHSYEEIISKRLVDQTMHGPPPLPTLPPWKYSGIATDGNCVKNYIDYWQYIKKNHIGIIYLLQCIEDDAFIWYHDIICWFILNSGFSTNIV